MASGGHSSSHFNINMYDMLSENSEDGLTDFSSGSSDNYRPSNESEHSESGKLITFYHQKLHGPKGLCLTKFVFCQSEPCTKVVLALSTKSSSGIKVEIPT